MSKFRQWATNQNYSMSKFRQCATNQNYSMSKFRQWALVVILISRCSVAILECDEGIARAG